MKQARAIALGFRAFDPHELLLHFIARELGYYAENGVQVHLRDLTFLPDETPGVDFTVACGAALMGWAKGIRRKIVFVATDHPMFWLHSAPEIAAVAQLKGARIAGYPAASPPEQFHRAILRRHGLNPEHDVILEAVRDDAARFGLLKARDVSAALISSAVPPPRLQSEGFRTLIFFGDYIRVPTTGLAVSEQILIRHPELVERMDECLAAALSALHEAPQKIIPVLSRFFGGSASECEETYGMIEKYFTPAGKAAPEAEGQALELLNQQLPSGQKLTPDDIYDYSLLPA